MTEPTVRFDRMPVAGPITGGFGAQYDGYKHRGVDIACPIGTPVYAPAAGTVVLPTNDGSFGVAVCLNHHDGWFTLYAHLSRNDTYIGQWVEACHQLGLSGDTGFTTGPHLHWQMSDWWTFPTDIKRSRDPLRYFVTEEEIMDKCRLKLLQAADAPFADMLAAYEHLRPRGYFDNWINRDGEPGPIDAKDDGWDAQARRSCLRWLATGDNARAAVEALGWAV